AVPARPPRGGGPPPPPGPRRGGPPRGKAGRDGERQPGADGHPCPPGKPPAGDGIPTGGPAALLAGMLAPRGPARRARVARVEIATVDGPTLKVFIAGCAPPRYKPERGDA